MAYGSHWEWRGFGGVSTRFAGSFTKLKSIYLPHPVTDRYLWFPGIKVNVKIRQGSENGLKFKRCLKTEAEFEIWSEPEDEFFEFPLNENSWKMLVEVLKNSELKKYADNNEPPPRPIGKEKLENWLLERGCKIIDVEKKRESRVWHSPEGFVLVEWSCISRPQSLVSIGLENYYPDDGKEMMGDPDQTVLENCIESLDLYAEPLRIMNYMDVLKIWARNNKI